LVALAGVDGSQWIGANASGISGDMIFR
jgi:hypothetical protein